METMPKRVDSNQREVVEGLRRLGVSVWCTHESGKGAPDIVAGSLGKNYLFEIKDEAKPPSQQKLTEDEMSFHNNWRGQIAVVHNLEEARAIIFKDI